MLAFIFPLIAFGAPSSLGSSPFSRVFVFPIMDRLSKRTVVLDGSGFAETVKVEDIASKIVECFGSENVLSVQILVMPGRPIGVTFENEPFVATVVRESSVSIDNGVCPLWGDGPRPENVLIFRYPFEADSAPLKEELSKYEEVHDIRFRAWTHLDIVMNAATVVRMTRSGPIPRSLHVSNRLCKTWYQGMRISCDICEGSHKAQNCPLLPSRAPLRSPLHPFSSNLVPLFLPPWRLLLWNCMMRAWSLCHLSPSPNLY